MFKKLMSITLATIIALVAVATPLFVSPNQSSALAVTMQRQNTIILELSTSSDEDDIDELRSGEGKLYNKIERTIERLQESGEVSENVQPIVVITKQKTESMW